MASIKTVSSTATIGQVALVFPGVPTFGRTVIGRGGTRIKAISVKDIGPGGISDSAIEDVTVEHLADAERYFVRPRDVLLSVRGTLSKVAIVPDRLAGSVATATLAMIRVLDADVLPEVLATYLASPHGQAQLTARARSATGQIALTAKDIREIEVPVPPMEVQRHIADLALEMDEYERAANMAIRQRREALAGIVATLVGTE